MGTSERADEFWIPISEEKPVPLEEVLIYDSEYDLVTIGYMADENTSWFYDGINGFSYSSITYWAPIPRPPAKKKIKGVKKKCSNSVDWVSVSDGLPNVGLKVWVYAPPLGVGLCAFTFRTEYGCGFIPEPGYEQISDEFYGKDGSLNCVTHWFPFRRSKKRPDAPSGERTTERTN